MIDGFDTLFTDWDIAEFGGLLIGERLTDIGWPYHLVVEILNVHEETGDVEDDKYIVTLSAVSPWALPEDTKNRALDSFGLPKDGEVVDDMELVYVVHQYGVHATLWSNSGDDLAPLIEEAARHVESCRMGLTGFYLDQTVNLTGTVGWEALQGKLVFRGLA